MRARRALAALAGLVVVLGPFVPAPAAGAEDLDAPVERILVVSLPGVSWGDTRNASMPNLEAIVDDAAVGILSSQIGRGPASATAAYLTVGAGTRSVAPAVDTSVALDEDELYDGISAQAILERRLGEDAPGVAYIAVGAALDVNADSSYGSEPGTLGDALADADVARAVIANADATEGFRSASRSPDRPYERSAVAALMGGDGIVPEGVVGRQLLVDDPEAPFGVRLSPDAVLGAFDASWTGERRAVVLVEASDLSRVGAYASRSTADQSRELRRDALEDADRLLGDLLERVDPDRDAVLVLSPVAPGGSGIVALRAPEVAPGLVRSATTRRSGYVLLADVAPTVMTLMGIEPPTSIEGRVFDVDEADGDRVGTLIDRTTAAGLRDDRLPVVVTVVIALLAVLSLGVLAGDRVPGRVRRWFGPLAVALLGVVPGTYLAGHLSDGTQGMGTYVAGVVAVAVVVGVAGWLVERRRPGAGIVVGLGSILALVAVDVLVGAPLQLNTVFGYSTAVAGRFAGLGNLAFALFSAAALTCAVVIVDQWGRRLLPVSIALLVGAVLVEGLPMVGADVGGVMSMVPAFALTGLVLAGRRIRLVHVVACLGASLAAVAFFALVDATRPAGSRTHLTRLGEHLVHGRFDAVGDTLVRRLDASFGSIDAAVWVLVLAIVLAALAHAAVVVRSRGAAHRRPPRDPAWLALAVGLPALAGLGLVVNDSSVAVPATMLIVIVPVLLTRHLRDQAATA